MHQLFIKTKYRVLLSSLIFFSVLGHSQNIYRTINGHVLTNGIYRDSVFSAQSHKLTLEYNSGNKSINGNVGIQTFSSNVLLIDSIISKQSTYINISGYIPVDFISWNHSDYNFDVPLQIKFEKIEIEVPAKLKFTHAEQLSPHTCMLSANFDIKLSDFISNIPKQMNDTIKVQFLQLVLRSKKR